MAILPINGISVSNKNNASRTSFTSLRTVEDDTNEYKKPRKANKLASVPVALLIAMTPAMMNGNEPIKAIPIDNENLTELLAYAAPGEIAEPEPQVRSSQETNYPLGIKYLTHKKIFAQTPIVTTNGEKATLVYAGSKEWVDDEPNKENVQFVYYIPQKHNLPPNALYLPEVRTIIYHNIGKDKEFAGIEVKFPEYKDGKRVSYIRKEIRLKDDDINELISFMVNEKAYKNRILNFKFRETTSAELMNPIRSEF